MKRLVAILMIFLLTICAAQAEQDAETEKYTRYTDYTPQKAEPVGLIPGDNHSVLVAWFSRVGNTVFDPDVDVVTTASLQTGDDGEMLGNAQLIAGWIAEATGADVFPIQTAYTYPSDYDQTVEVGEGQDIDQLEPELAAHLEDVSGYDTVWLVAPVWHYTICTPLRVFLNETDLSGKTVYVVTTHRGSGFADVPERIREMEPKASVVAALAVPGNDAAKHFDEVMEYVNKTIH
ncbi:MAG: flavodoxin [Clostridia bacterium]|nr:flavodoxin [Clostridia bacterium]